VHNPTASRADIARLFGRAAFGATAADLATWTGKPYAAAVDFLTNVPTGLTRLPAADEPYRLTLEQGPITVDFSQLWWLERMRSTPYPLEERMTLFLHDHFATSVLASNFPDSGHLVKQNETIRKRALGNFRLLCEELTVDAAMLFWLNGNVNVAGKPNENFAREFFELFTLGTIPQVYTETDIRESARALTGWSVDGLRTPVFTAANHDAGSKTILGQAITDKGAGEYKEVVRIALAQPVASRFLAYKLVTNFAYVPTTTDLLVAPDPLVASVATVLATSWDLRAAVRAMLLDDRFRYADPALGQQSVRQPIEIVVHAAKALELNTFDTRLLPVLARMGQKPFQPPNVSGWPTGELWLSPTTTIARYDFGILTAQLGLTSVGGVRWPAAADLAGWATRLGLAGLTEQTTRVVQDYLATAVGASELQRQTGVVALLLSSPDWTVM
jgi:uncharacterized protein (DUF1800 family)